MSLTLKHDTRRSSVAFNFNLRRCNKAAATAAAAAATTAEKKAEKKTEEMAEDLAEEQVGSDR